MATGDNVLSQTSVLEGVWESREAPGNLSTILNRSNCQLYRYQNATCLQQMNVIGLSGCWIDVIGLWVGRMTSFFLRDNLTLHDENIWAEGVIGWCLKLIFELLINSQVICLYDFEVMAWKQILNHFLGNESSILSWGEIGLLLYAQPHDRANNPR